MAACGIIEIEERDSAPTVPSDVSSVPDAVRRHFHRRHSQTARSAIQYVHSDRKPGRHEGRFATDY